MAEKALVGGVTIAPLYLDEDVNRNFSCTESRRKRWVHGGYSVEAWNTGYFFY